jgi:hypothetical protein
LIPKIRFRTVPELRHQHQEWQRHELDEFRKALNPAMSEIISMKASLLARLGSGSGRSVKGQVLFGATKPISQEVQTYLS